MKIANPIHIFPKVMFLLGLIGLPIGLCADDLFTRNGLVDATAAPFFADPTGQHDSSEAINAALLYGRENHMVTYLPAGDYLVRSTIRLSGRDMQEANSSTNDYFCVLQGEVTMDGRRTRIILDDNAPGFNQRNPVAIVVHGYYPSGTGYNYTGHFNQLVRNLDIVIGHGNSGAVGLRLQGAEGTLVEDVTIDATHGWKGVWGLPGSGGSTHKLTVIGGEIGVDLRGYSDQGALAGVGTQPGPMISQLRLIDQTEVPLITRTRGSLTLVGVEVRTPHARHAFDIGSIGSNQPWGGSISVIDGAIDLTSTNGTPAILVKQNGLGVVPGRGYTLHHVFVKGAGLLDSVSNQQLSAGDWTRIHEFAMAVPPAAFQGNAVREVIMLDGHVQQVSQIFDAVAGEAPPLDLAAYHGYGQLMPLPTHPGVVNILDFGADPTGTSDSTEALREAIASGRDVFVPKGTFMISDTVSLNSDTRLFGIHPHLSLIRARDLPSARFAGLPDAGMPAPMIVSPDDRNARTVISMLGIKAPRGVANHRAIPVLAYPLKWQSGRRSVIHHSQFTPYGQVNWRVQLVMQNDFKLAYENSPYSNGGLRFASNDVASRIFIEQLGDSQRVSMPYNRAGSTLTIDRADGTAFGLSSLELSKMTFGDGIAYEVRIEGTRTDNSTVAMTVPFDADWTDRAAFKLIEPQWQNLRKVVLHAPMPFGIDHVVSSHGTADFERRRPFYVPVDCGDMRYGFEHFPFAVIRHPQVLITGNGGGRWYNSFYHGDIWAGPDFNFIEVRDTSEPLNIYHWHLQHIHSDSQAAFNRVRNVQVFGFKAEHNSRFLTVRDSDQIRLFGWGGLADAAVGDAHFRFENSTNFLHAAMAEEPHFIAIPEVWSTCDNPLIVHHVNLFDGIQEIVGNDTFATPVLSRSILYKRGQPADPLMPGSYAEWAERVGLVGELAAPAALTDDSGQPNLIRYALGMETDPWNDVPAPLAIVPAEGGVEAVVRSPFRRSGVEVNLLVFADLRDRSPAQRISISPIAGSDRVPATFSYQLPDARRTFLQLEAQLISAE